MILEIFSELRRAQPGGEVERYAALGVERLMGLMQSCALPQDAILESIRIAGEILIPKLKDFGRQSP